MNYAVELTFKNILIISMIIFLLNLHLYKLKIKINYIFYANVFLMFIAFVEPSPSDIIFISMLLFCIKEKKFSKLKLSKMIMMICPMLTYVVIATLSMLNMKHFDMGVRFYGITLYLVAYSLLIFLFVDSNNYIKILKIYIISSTLAACLGIVGYLGYFSDYLLFDPYRTKALFKDPNVFGAFLIPSILLLIADYRSQNIFTRKNNSPEQISQINFNTYRYTILIVVNFIGVVISFSRGAWISSIVGIIIIGLMNLKRLKFKKTVVLSSVIILIMLILWFNVFSIETKNFFLERFSIKAYDSDRFAVQLIGFRKALDHVFGYGPGQYENVILQAMGEEYSAHSLYARIMLENGILGIILLLFVFIYILTKLFRKYKAEDQNFADTGYFSIIISLLINSLVIDTLHWRHLWLFLGLSMSSICDVQKLPRRQWIWKEGRKMRKAYVYKVVKILQDVTYIIIRNILAFIGMILYTNKRQNDEILILMYHKVHDHINQAIAVKEASFRWQMEYLNKKGYKVISMEEAFQKIKEKAINGKYIVLSFDDGYEDFYDTVHPILKKYCYPAILYLIPGYIETDKVFPWDMEQGKSELMSWDQIKRLSEDPLIIIGSHTLNHYDMDTLEDTTLRNELEESKKLLEEKLGTKIIHFAYPRGSYSMEVEKLLHEFYETGVLIYKGIVINNSLEQTDHFRLKRIPVYRSDGRFMFIARLKGWIKLEEMLRRKFKA